MSNVVAWPGSPQHREDAATELDRLRAIEADLSRPVLELATEIARLRAVDHQARELARKVAEHERRGYGRIKLGAFRALRNVLEG